MSMRLFFTLFLHQRGTQNAILSVSITVPLQNPNLTHIKTRECNHLKTNETEINFCNGAVIGTLNITPAPGHCFWQLPPHVTSPELEVFPSLIYSFGKFPDFSHFSSRIISGTKVPKTKLLMSLES